MEQGTWEDWIEENDNLTNRCEWCGKPLSNEFAVFCFKHTFLFFPALIWSLFNVVILHREIVVGKEQ